MFRDSITVSIFLKILLIHFSKFCFTRHQPILVADSDVRHPRYVSTIVRSLVY